MRYLLRKLILLVILHFGKLEAVILLDDKCQPGDTPMMINGGNANRAPWMAYLIRDGKYICSGSLVNSQFVLTAAHCATSMDNLVARLGEYDSSTTSDGETYDFAVTAVFSDPCGQDIALLKLAKRVTIYSATIRPICIVLFKTECEKQELYSVNNFTVTGWGHTSRINGEAATILQEISVSRISPSLCGNPPVGKFCCQSPTQFICHGDSGSPLTSDHKYNHVTSTVQHGILSSGHERCHDYGIYVDIVPYTAWISDTILKNSQQYTES
ncbi:hypothetical protein KR054_000507 [Drosophila jambulina]|nr:hypothetical protein KR054_000507 [Drosophila jambulina]